MDDCKLITIKDLKGSIGLKLNEAPVSTQQESELNLKLNEFHASRRELLNEPHVELSKNISIGKWTHGNGSVRLIKTKGKFIHYMGYYSDRDCLDHLYLEEALFLLESSKLQVLNEATDLPLSIEDAYKWFFVPIASNGAWQQQQANLSHYIVYSYLLRLGYIVVRSPSSPLLLPLPLTSTTSSVDLNEDDDEQIEGENRPLLNLDDILNDRFDNLYQIKSTGPSTLDGRQDEKLYHQLVYDVYLPNKNFKKSSPGPPKYRVHVLGTDKRPGDQIQIPNSHQLSNDVESRHLVVTSTLYAYVDYGNVLFYSYTKFPSFEH